MTVRDNGSGGADPRRGTGLRGLNDRVAALDGRFEVISPPGGGTAVDRRAAAGAGVRRAFVVARRAGRRSPSTGCDSGPPVSQTRDLGGFTRLEVSGDLSLDIRLFNRPDPGVRITAGTKSIDRIKTEVVGDVLRVSTKSRGLTIGPDPLGDVAISLGVPALLALRVDDQADVTLSGLSAKSFELRVDGSGLVRARGPRRRPRDGGRRLRRHGPGRPGHAERERAHATARATPSCASPARSELIVEGSGDVTYRGRPSVSSRLGGLGQRAPGPPLTTATRRWAGSRVCEWCGWALYAASRSAISSGRWERRLRARSSIWRARSVETPSLRPAWRERLGLLVAGAEAHLDHVALRLRAAPRSRPAASPS